MIDGTNQTTTIDYDYGAGKATSVTDPLLNKTSYVYNDAFDRVTRITQPSLAQTNILYFNPQWVITYQDQVANNGSVVQVVETQAVYDNFGRLTENRLVVDADSLIDVAYGYDGLGRRTLAANPTKIQVSGWTNDGLNYATTTTYDSLNRPLTVTSPFTNADQSVGSQTARTSYQGYTTTFTDPAGTVKQTTSDVFGHVASVIEDAGHLKYQTNYSYDLLGDLTNVMKCAAGPSGPDCSSGQLRTFTYDGLGRLTSANNPESNTFTYSYVDSNGNNRLALQSRTDPRNITATYSYDGAGRTVGISYNDSVTPSATYTYDAAGRLTQSSTGYVANNYTSFDGDGRVLASNVQINRSKPYTFQYSYDLAGDLLSETYPTGRVVNTTYDAAARPQTVTAQGAAKPYVQQVGYWPHGSVYYWQYGNNVWPVEGYTAQLTPWYNYATQNNSSNSWLTWLNNNSWNANGTVSQATEAYGAAVPSSSLTVANQNYSYDPLKRLLGVTDTNYSRGFSYDEFGNMSVSAYGTIDATGLTPQSGGTPPNPYDPATNRLVSTLYGYDARGDMTKLGTTTMTYDAEGNQISTADSGVGGQSVSYAFDAEGQRVVKQVAGGATVFDIHDAFGRLAVEYSSASLTAACNTCYLMYDGVGSVRLITDENGGLVARHDYLPYGEEIADGTAGRSGKFGYSSNVRQGFTGQEADGGTPVLDYFNARHMSAVLGSFTQPDPMQAGADFLNPQSWNGYAYVLGNPIGNADPSGACTVVLGGITQSRDPNSGVTSIAQGLGAVEAYPYAGLGPVASTLHVFAQGFVPTINTQVAEDALRFALSTNGGKIDVVAYSGGAGAFTAAYSQLSSGDQQRIGNILYLSPGSSGSLEINGTTSIVRGNDPADVGAMIGTGYPIGVPVEQAACKHRDVACLSNTATAINAFNAMETNGPCTSQMTFSFHWPWSGTAPGSGGNGGGGGVWPGPGIPWSPVTVGTIDPVPVVTSTVKFQ